MFSLWHFVHEPLLCVHITVERGSFGKRRLKQVAHHPSYFTLPDLESIQSIQLGHLAPPPCALHLPDLPRALFVQLGSTHSFLLDR